MIVAALRVKNEGRWLGEVLDALKPVCQHLFVFDDHSADNTVQVAKEHGGYVIRTPFEGLNEARDKTFLSRQIINCIGVGHWVLMIDGDEVLAPWSVGKVKEAAMVLNASAYDFRIRYLWNDRDTVRMDGVYAKFRRPSMYKLREDCSFMLSGAAGNFHCSSVPQSCIGRCRPADVDLLHLGYMDSADRVRKWQWYNALDGRNPNEDGYRHIVVGDIFPPSATFRHGGPLKLEALCTQAV